MITETVFLTGATGTVGSGVLEILISAGYKVHCLIRQADAVNAIKQAGGQPVVGDMTDQQIFRRLSAERSFTYIVHTAQAHYRHHSAEEIARQERLAVQNLELLCNHATRLMVFTCGVWIYGKCAEGSSIDEATPHAPRRAAALRSLLMSDLAARRESKWAQLCLPSFVYGSTGPLMEMAQRFRKGDVELLDDESVQWSVIERLDLGRVYLALLQHGKPGDYYVVAEDTPVGVLAMNEAVAEFLQRGRVIRKRQSDLVQSPEEKDALRLITHHRVDSSRFKRHTGWRARESFLQSFVRFLPSRSNAPDDGSQV